MISEKSWKKATVQLAFSFPYQQIVDALYPKLFLHNMHDTRIIYHITLIRTSH